MTGFLAGTRVLEWGEGFSAPFCTRILADLGAEVIKVERPGDGDSLRGQGPFWAGSPYPNASALFACLNYGKRSITLDPAKPTGAAIFRRLAEASHVVVDSQPPGAATRYGLDGDSLRVGNPGLVVLSVTPFGQTGPLQHWAASDLTLQHLSGYAYHQARPVVEPEQKPPVGCADREGPLSVGLAGAMAAVWGLLMAHLGQRGPSIDLSAQDCLAHLLVEPVAEWSRGERRFDRLGKDAGAAEVAGGLVWIIACSDGWVMVSPREQHQWQRWAQVLGDPEWAHDAALCGDRATRKAHAARLQALMSEWSITHTRQEVFERAQEARVACFPVSTPADLLDNQQLHNRRFFQRLRSACGQAVLVPGLPFRIQTSDGGELPRGGSVTSPALGEGNQDVLGGLLGLPSAELERLRLAGVI